jgi:hypothetical protein
MLPSRCTDNARILLVNPKVPYTYHAYALVKGPEIWTIRRCNSTRVAWKQDDQQYLYVF